MLKVLLEIFHYEALKQLLGKFFHDNTMSLVQTKKLRSYTCVMQDSNIYVYVY